MAPKTPSQLALIFDLDGTIIDNTRAHIDAWVEMGKLYDFPMSHELYLEKFHARSNHVILATIFGPELTPEKSSALARQKEAVYRELYRPNARERPGLTNLLREAQRRSIPCAICSNSPIENVEFSLDQLQIREYFDVVVKEGDAKRGKPAPDLYFVVYEKLGVSAENCIIFEDAPAGMQSAIESGGNLIQVGLYEDIPRDERALAYAQDFTSVDLDELCRQVSL